MPNNRNLKKKSLKTKHAFLRTLFTDPRDRYAVQHMNGFVLVRQFNAPIKEWEVAIFTEESYAKREHWKENRDKEKSLSDSQE